MKRRDVIGILALAIILVAATVFLTRPSLIRRAMGDRVMTILSLGDSYTTGETVASDERWPDVLAKSHIVPHGTFVDSPTMIAQTGWTTDELSNAIDRAGIDGKTFDLVTLLIGVNNQYRGRTVEDFRPQFIELLSRAIHFAKNDPKRVLVVSIPDWGVMPFANGRDRVTIGSEIDAFNSVCHEEADRAGARFVDITPISREAPKDPSLIASDGLHPSAKQYRRWVDELIAPAATSAMSDRAAASSPTTQAR